MGRHMFKIFLKTIVSKLFTLREYFEKIKTIYLYLRSATITNVDIVYILFQLSFLVCRNYPSINYSKSKRSRTDLLTQQNLFGLRDGLFFIPHYFINGRCPSEKQHYSILSPLCSIIPPLTDPKFPKV